ncbi:ImmA/IrrE family metallo-endopeptidase [Prosthecochloris sp. HL-130-GSB]|jgi:Zn-dependent peptidase ImmA (M78 family)|uniref:ImmA/IrrE family metallo-endopeptidase n=1 Tax=Prosthecochloris sp. HL-130-GSB TaxID=1974213 RepID=UPI000A1C1914|nr:ImmA/IrrE family metallo-endopeptidase [Prosthecochloris sp. HL-130-GSB]ARM31755.1 peptidase [Prosthecochloris sp. HL-130-GSB]
MERLQSINHERILWCCADYGITPGELAAELGIAPGSMDRVFAGEDGMTFNQLRKMANFFGRGILFFLEEGLVDEAQVHTAQFRTLTNQKPEVTPTLKKFIERVERQRDVYLGLLDDLNETERVRFSPPDLQEKPIPEAARIVRAWLGLGGNNDFYSYRTAVEAKGILVFRSNGYSGKWQIPKESPIIGFTLYDPDCPVIVVKKQASERRQTFTLMHELGHLLLHRSSSIDDYVDLDSPRGQERDANFFAGHLLVPDTFLSLIDDSKRPTDVSQFDTWLDMHCKAWGVSCEVILRRLLNAGRLSHGEYAAYRQWHGALNTTQQEGGNRQYRHREPIHVFGDTYVKTVLDALNARQITLSRASSYLDSIKIKDLHSLEHFYAGR